MVELVTTELWENACLAFKKANPDWILLDRQKVIELAEESKGGKDSKYSCKHFILPYDLVSRRYASTRMNMLVIYLLVRSRRVAWTFTIIAPSKDRLDQRAQRMVDKAV